MEKKDRFKFYEIVLDNNKSRYHAGEDVSGIIKFAVKRSAIVANIKICLICVSEVEWVDIPNITTSLPSCDYHDKIMLIKDTFNLPKEYMRLSEGEHEVPFKFKLSEIGIPSSFVGPHGSIKYFIEVVKETESCEEPGVKKDHIVGICELKLDVPSHEKLNITIGCSKEKDFELLSLSSGKINLYAGVFKKGWAPGEIIELHVTVDNQSTTDVTPRATLYQIQTYMCEQGQKILHIPLTDAIVGRKVDKHLKFTQTLSILIPKHTSLTIKSPLISVKYFVHVTLDIPHAFDIHVNVPVVMTNKSVQRTD